MSIALTVEDGTLVSSANTFVSLATADEYHQYRGHVSTWSGDGTTFYTAEQRSSALIRAADYLCRHYHWKGERYDEYQALCWPRDGLYDLDGFAISTTIIPDDIKWAQCELALKALTNDLDADQDRGGRIKSESIGEISVTYMDGAPSGKTWTNVDRLVGPYVKGKRSTISPTVEVKRS